MATTTLQFEGVVYSIHSHRDGNGHFATWECVTCGTAGGKSKVYADEHSASEATRLLIVDHQSRRHSAASPGGLSSLVYCSQAVTPFSKAGLEDLAQHAAAKNGFLDVTGYLTYDLDFETFFQFLEGPQAVIETLMNVIAKDPRHRVPNIVRISEAERQFAAASAAASAWSRPPVDISIAASQDELRMFSSWRMKLITRTDFQIMDMEDVVIEILTSMRKQNLGGKYITGSILDMSYLLKFRAPLAML